MLGMICKLTSNQLLAEKMLSYSFLKVKEYDLLASIGFKRSPTITILRHTYQSAVQYLENKKIPLELCASTGQLGILWLICTQCRDLKTLSVQLGIPEADARKKLFSEFSLLSVPRQAISFAA